MGSLYTYNQNQIRMMFKLLRNLDIYTNEKVVKKLSKLVKEDVDSFIADFALVFSQKDYSYNKFEVLKLSNSDKRKLDNNKLYRYEYRKKSNLRTLFVVIKDNNSVLVLEAFNENENKSNGKDSYDKAIKNAITNYLDIKEEIDE